MGGNRRSERQRLTREQKIKEALHNKTNRYGMTPRQLHDALTKTKKAQAKDESRRNIVSRKNSTHKKPEKATRNPKFAFQPKTYVLESPNVSSSQAIEYPTPSWFRSDEKADVSIIVPLYKSNAVLTDLIQSWNFDHEDLKIELIMVDDLCPVGSKDAAYKEWLKRREEITKKGVKVGRIYQNVANMGFGVTSNTGAYHATGDYLIFLNSDTIVTPGWIRPIIRLLRKEEVGIVGNLQIKHGGIWNGTIDGAGSEWLWDDMCFVHVGRHCYNHFKLAQPFHLNNCPEDLLKASERDMVTGCCFGIRKDLFKEIGGFNPNYRIGYWEDSEICMTVKELGYKVMYQPNSKIYHKLGHSSSNSGPHKFHDHNRNYFMNKWVNSGRIDDLVTQKRDKKPTVQTILLKRTNANGDVLMASAVAKALKKKHKCQILFCTNCPSVIENNPYIDKIIDERDVSERTFSVCYNLDMIYEYRPYTNILDAYAQHVGVKKEDCELYLNTEPVDDLPENYVVVHSGKTSWVGRDWSHEKFSEIANFLREAGHTVVCVGQGGDHLIPCDMDLRNKTTISQLAHVMKNAKLFVGIDSFPMHVAQAMNTPGVVFFGSVKPETRIVTENMTGVSAPHTPCLGCHHRKLSPCTNTNNCETGNLECIDRVTVEQMWNQIKEKIGE